MSTLSYLIDLDTELSAVNSILGSIGQAPITDLQFENPEISFVYRIFQDTVLDVLSEGWSFNTFYEVELQPDNDQLVWVPDNILKIDASNNSYDRSTDVVVFDKKLYDKYNHTDKFEDPITVTYIQALDWPDIPAVFKRYIIARASVRAATQMVTNKELVALLASQESYLRASCVEFECNQGDYSYFGTPNGSVYQSYQPFNALSRF
jgi:hypothetical protein